MSYEVREVELKPQKAYDINESVRPTVIKWKGVPMVRTHSIGACVQEILNAIAVEGSQDVVNINMIGLPSSGKTTQAKLLGHLIHKRSKIPFSVRLFAKEELLDFKKTLKTLAPANYVLIFDDLSFLGGNASSKQIEYVKQATTEIRHLPGGEDVKIVMIKDFHYTLALNKYLRQNDFSFFTTVGSEEIKNMQDIVGIANMGKVRHFQNIKNIIKIAPEGNKKFKYILGKRGSLEYTYRQPFIPMLYWNGSTLRHVVSPKREWVDPICSTCEEYTNKEKIESNIDIPKFIENSNDSYGESKVKLAVLLHLNESGIKCFSPKVISAYRFIQKAKEKKVITNEDLAVYYGLTPTKTKMKKNVDEALESSKLEAKKDEDKELLDIMLDQNKVVNQ